MCEGEGTERLRFAVSREVGDEDGGEAGGLEGGVGGPVLGRVMAAGVVVDVVCGAGGLGRRGGGMEVEVVAEGHCGSGNDKGLAEV